MLFKGISIDEFLNKQLRNITQEIENEKEEYLVNIVVNDYKTYLTKKNKIEPIILLTNQVWVEEAEELVKCTSSYCSRRLMYGSHEVHYVKAQVFTYFVPYEGKSELFSVQPNIIIFRDSSQIYVNQKKKEVSFKIINYQNNMDIVNREYQGTLDFIKESLESMERNIISFNDSLSSQIENIYKSRKDRILKRWEMISQSVVPIKKRENPTALNIDPKKVKPIIIKPESKTKIFPQSFYISDEIYNQILNIINGVGINFSKLTSTSINKNEEQLRDHILVTLQSHFENASVVGEAFNRSGKTDILIKHKDNNVFVAECKFWSGESNYLKAIDQLLGYLTWTDTKTSLIIFVKEKSFSNILQKIHNTTQKHPNFLNIIKKDDNIFKYVFHINGDTERKFDLTVMAYKIIN